MAIPTGPAGRGKPKKPQPIADFVTTPTAKRTTDRLSPEDLARARAAAERADARGLLERTPSEIHARHDAVSPAVLTLTLADFFDLFYQNRIGAADITIRELLQMRDNFSWPEPFTAGDPRTLFTEAMCRRGEFVPLAWHDNGLYFATCKDDASQDELIRALDLLVRAEVTLFTATPEVLDAAITWLYRRPA
jgi:hypothetical protein